MLELCRHANRSRATARFAAALLLLGLQAGCASFSFNNGSARRGGSAGSGGAYARLVGGANNHLLGDVVWPDDHTLLMADVIQVRLTGAGSDGAPKPASCSIQACKLGGDGSGWPLEGLSEGAYAIEARYQAKTLAHIDVKLVRVPTLGGTRSLVPDDADRFGTFETVFRDNRVWLPRDKRQPNREVALVWFHDGAFVASRAAKVDGPDLDGPLYDFATVPAPKPPLPRGLMNPGDWEVFVIWKDSKELAGHFQWTEAENVRKDLRAMGQRGGAAQEARPLPWSIVTSSSAPEGRLKTALQNLPVGAPPAKPRSEAWACAVSLDSAATPIVKHIQSLRAEIRKLVGRAIAVAGDAMDEAKSHAHAQGREITDQERDFADAVGAAAGNLSQPAVMKLWAALKAEEAKLDGLASKQHAGCLEHALPDSFQSIAHHHGASH